MVRALSIVTAALQALTVLMGVIPFALSILEYNDNEVVNGINILNGNDTLNESQCNKNDLFSKHRPIRFKFDDLDGYFYCNWGMSNSMLHFSGPILIAVFTLAMMITWPIVLNTVKKTRVLTTAITSILVLLALGIGTASCYYDMKDITESRDFCTNTMKTSIEFFEVPEKISCNYDKYITIFALDVCACTLGLISLICAIVARVTKKRGYKSEGDRLIQDVEWDSKPADNDEYEEENYSRGKKEKPDFNFDYKGANDNPFDVENNDVLESYESSNDRENAFAKDEDKKPKRKMFWQRKAAPETKPADEDAYDFENKDKFGYFPPSIPQEEKKPEKKESNEPTNPFDDEPSQEQQQQPPAASTEATEKAEGTVEEAKPKTEGNSQE